jgi:beta-mannosidase
MIGDFQSSPEGVGYPRYAEDMSRFVSEFGLQAAPALETLKRWMDPADLTPESEGFLARIKDEARKADAMMTPVTGLPTTLGDYVDFTQWCQAEGLKLGIEHFRRRRPHCSGAVLWQLNDCWPCVSWSLIDWDGVEKASFHTVRRAFASVLASFKILPDGQVELWITNDTATPVTGEVVVTLESLSGDIREHWTVPVNAPAEGHQIAWRGTTPTGNDLILHARSTDAAFERACLLSAPIRDLELIPARPVVTMTRLAPTRLQIDMRADVCLLFVHLVSARPDLRFSDNHFDLVAGETRRVIVEGSSLLSAEDLIVRCWNDRTGESGL